MTGHHETSDFRRNREAAVGEILRHYLCRRVRAHRRLALLAQTCADLVGHGGRRGIVLPRRRVSGRRGLLRPLNLIWLKFGLLLHKIVNPIVMGLLFYVVFTPMGFIMRLAGKDLAQSQTRQRRGELLESTPGFDGSRSLDEEPVLGARHSHAHSRCFRLLS